MVSFALRSFPDVKPGELLDGEMDNFSPIKIDQNWHAVDFTGTIYWDNLTKDRCGIRFNQRHLTYRGKDGDDMTKMVKRNQTQIYCTKIKKGLFSYYPLL